MSLNLASTFAVFPLSALYVFPNRPRHALFLPKSLNRCRKVPITRLDARVRQAPAIVKPSMRRVGQAVEERNSKSLPIETMLRNMSFRPDAPRE